MKIKPKHIALSVNNWNAKSQDELAVFITEILDEQTSVGGQLWALIVQEEIPANLVEVGIKMACIMLYSVKKAGCRLPLLTHEMFLKEYKNIDAFLSLMQSGENGVMESMLKGSKEKILLAYVTNELKELHLEHRHPKGYLITAVIMNLFNLVDKNLKYGEYR